MVRSKRKWKKDSPEKLAQRIDKQLVQLRKIPQKEITSPENKKTKCIDEPATESSQGDSPDNTLISQTVQPVNEENDPKLNENEHEHTSDTSDKTEEIEAEPEKSVEPENMPKPQIENALSAITHSLHTLAQTVATISENMVSKKDIDHLRDIIQIQDKQITDNTDRIKKAMTKDEGKKMERKIKDHDMILKSQAEDMELGNQISRCYHYCYLGVKLDGCLNLKQNYNNIFKKFSYKIHQFGKIKKYLDMPTRVLVYKQTVMPLVEYVSYMLNMNNTQQIEKLQRLQNRALRMCFNINNPMDIGINVLHDRSQISPLQKRRDMSLLCLMYDLKQLHLYELIGERATRQGDKYTFTTNVSTTSIYERSPYYTGSKLWNNLPAYVQNARSKTQFKCELKSLWG